MTYIDSFLVPVPRANRARYEELARLSWQVLREYGALRAVESWLDEAGPEAATYHADDARQDSSHYPTFRRAAGAHNDEAVVMSWVEWPDKQTRDEGMKKFTSDPRMQFSDPAMMSVFEGSRLIAGGFVPMLQEELAARAP